jgi:ParB/RepB/Spo0J family partition protein
MLCEIPRHTTPAFRRSAERNPDLKGVNDVTGAYQEIPITQIQPNPGNPRKSFDQDALNELAASIRENGVIEPLVVTADDNGGFVLVCGERRWRAAQLAGAELLPCIVRDLTPAQAAEIMLIENVQRRDLDPIEEAQAFQALIGQHGYTQESLAERVGVSQGQIANRLRLLRLPAEVQDGISRKILPAAGAMELLKLEKSPLMADVTKTVLGRDLTVKQTADTVASAVRNQGRPLDPKEWNGPRFDVSGCQKCELSAKIQNYDGNPLSRCLNPACWDKKQSDHATAEDKARKAALKETGGKVLDIEKLGHNDYVRFIDTHQWKGIDQSECEACPQKQPGKDWNGRILDVCTDPLCHRKKERAVTKAENAAKKSALEAEMDEIAARAEHVGTDKRMFIYLAALLLREVRPEYERPTVTKYLKDAFGWEDGFWKSAYEMRGQAFDKVLERLESLTPTQLVKGILCAWPAVALGTKDKLIRYALRMDEGQPATAEPETPEGAERLDDPSDDEVSCPECGMEMRRDGDFWVCSDDACGTRVHEQEWLHGPIQCPDCYDWMNYDHEQDVWRCPCGKVELGSDIRATAEDPEGVSEAAPEAGSADELATDFQCPQCGSKMREWPKGLIQCANDACRAVYPRLELEQEACPGDQAIEDGTVKAVDQGGAAPEAGNGTLAEKIVRFLDPKTGKLYEVCQGLGDTLWGLFECKPNGSLRRVNRVEVYPGKLMAEAVAAEYAEKHGWREEAAQPGKPADDLEILTTMTQWCQFCAVNTRQDLVEVEGAGLLNVKKWRCQDCGHLYTYHEPPKAPVDDDVEDVPA